jgi:hypothetical protein
MRNALPANVPLIIVIFAAGAAVALWAAARRPGPSVVLGPEPAPVTATAEDSLPRPAVIAGVHHTTGQEMAKPRGTPGRPDGSAEQTQHVFHELHAEGRHALCEVCANRYRH